MENKYEGLQLDNQLCFPLYAASKEVIKKYRPFLDKIGLTYTQYITMMVMWEHQKMNVKDLGVELFLDSGTLTPVLKELETKGYLKRERSSVDERVLLVSLTPNGEKLKDRAVSIPKTVATMLKLDQKEALELYRILYKILRNLNQE